MNETYDVIPGLDGTYGYYRLAILDANVAKELERFYRVGFIGMADDGAKERVKAFLLTNGMADEVYPGAAAMELAQPYNGRFEQAKHDTYVHAVHSVAGMDQEEWREVYTTGVALSKIRPAAATTLDAEGWTSSQLPEILGDAAVLAKTWRLLEEKVQWDQAVSALAAFCDSTIRYVPAMAFMLGLTLLAGQGNYASEFRRVLKFSPHTPTLERAKRVFNAAFDLRFLATIASMPTTHRLATGEILSPACGLTADKGTVALARILERYSNTEPNAQSNLGVRIWEPVFSEKRHPSILRIQDEINIGQTLRRRTPTELADDTRTTLFACASYLDSTFGSNWSSEAEAVDAGEHAWWHARDLGHAAWSRAQRMGWEEGA